MGQVIFIAILKNYTNTSLYGGATGFNIYLAPYSMV